MTSFPPTTHVAASLRDLPHSIPYTRLFGTHFMFDDDTSPLRHPGPRERELERC